MQGASTGGQLVLAYGVTANSARSNESWFVLGPGRQETYCQGSPSDHTWTSQAAISMQKCISYSSHAALLGALWCSFRAVWRWATIHWTMSHCCLALTAMYRVEHLIQVMMSRTRNCVFWLGRETDWMPRPGFPAVMVLAFPALPNEETMGLAEIPPCQCTPGSRSYQTSFSGRVHSQKFSDPIQFGIRPVAKKFCCVSGYRSGSDWFQFWFKT